MKTKEILERLEEAKKIISAFPPDINIIDVVIAGVTYSTGECEAEKGGFQINNSMQKLTGSRDEYMGCPVTRKKSGTWTCETIILDGFRIFETADSSIKAKKLF